MKSFKFKIDVEIWTQKKPLTFCGLERKTGLEPATYSLEGCRSTK